MSDRIAVMNHGRFEQVARARGGLRAPGDHLRRRLHRRLQPDAREHRRGRTSGEREVRLDTGIEVDAAVDGLAVGERIHAVVRPEKLGSSRRLHGDAPTDGPRSQGMVESSVYLGTATQIVVGLAGDVTDDRARARTPTSPSARDYPAAARRCGSSWAPSAHPPRPRIRGRSGHGASRQRARAELASGPALALAASCACAAAVTVGAGNAGNVEIAEGGDGRAAS